MSIVKPSSTKKIYIATTSNEDELKEQKSLYSSLYNANKIEDMSTIIFSFALTIKILKLLKYFKLKQIF